MSKWNKISLFKFQSIDEINQRDIPDIDKTLFAVCQVFNYTETRLDNLADTWLGKRKAARLIQKTADIFSSPFTPKPVKWFGKYKVEYNPANLTFGQYIELSYFLQSPKGDAHIRNGHYILASICNYPCILKRFSGNHPKKAAYFLTQPVENTTGTISVFIENFQAFNKEYSGLFGLSDTTSEEVKQDKFNKRYGWIYSATVLADYEKITLEQAYKLPIRQALNDLMYLKEKAAYDEQLLKKA